MSCPPGTALNPYSLHCVKLTGRKARELVRLGALNPVAYQQPYHPFWDQRPVAPPARAVTRKANRGARGVGAFGMYAGPAPRQPQAPRVTAAAAPALFTGTTMMCPAGSNRNPTTGRCIKIGGRTYKRVHPAPIALAVQRRELTEGPITLPVGTAAVAPLGDDATVVGWARDNCANNADPISKVPFASAETAALQEMIRLHNRTCVTASLLHSKVAAEHKAGAIATIPGSDTHLTLDDFKALRDAMRRRDPGYKIPGRKHQPPPPEWQLYVAADNRSGPEFVSVMYVDVTKGRPSRTGIDYPADAVRIDMGFLPATGLTGALCTLQTVVELLQRLDTANRLLAPVAGGWKPVTGFPFTKKYWENDRNAKFGRLCRDLAKALTQPF